MPQGLVFPLPPTLIFRLVAGKHSLHRGRAILSGVAVTIVYQLRQDSGARGNTMQIGGIDISEILPFIAVGFAAQLVDGALSFLYLLHPDPWPKARHAKRRMMNDGPVRLFADKLKPGGEFRFGTDHVVYLRHALMVMRRHRDPFEWLCETPADFQNRPGGWPETRYEHKARTVYGHEVWYFRFRRR